MPTFCVTEEVDELAGLKTLDINKLQPSETIHWFFLVIRRMLKNTEAAKA